MLMHIIGSHRKKERERQTDRKGESGVRKNGSYGPVMRALIAGSGTICAIGPTDGTISSRHCSAYRLRTLEFARRFKFLRLHKKKNIQESAERSPLWSAGYARAERIHSSPCRVYAQIRARARARGVNISLARICATTSPASGSRPS